MKRKKFIVELKNERVLRFDDFGLAYQELRNNPNAERIMAWYGSSLLALAVVQNNTIFQNNENIRKANNG